MGGLVGINDLGGIINNSYSTGNVSGTNIRIYFRIGLPMNIQFTFTTITAYFHT